ncbi:DUF6168 family protein [Lacinutrix sp.]|uniref:DUF6168 family protein n=1 Tax=Lacinutrix sp. TaxID=1937692 RepID=UPI0034545FF2
MIKKITAYLLSFIVLLGIAFSLHSYILYSSEIELKFSLLNIYVFHCVVSFLISTVIVLLSNSERWSAQLGFIYIFTLINKFMFFGITFKSILFQTEKLTKIESLNLLIPLFLFLFLEVYFIVKVLNKK